MRTKTEDDKKFVVKWKKRRSKKTLFVILRALLYGLVGGSLVFGVMSLERNEMFRWNYLAIYIAMFSLIGVIHGWRTFISNEKRYERIQSKETINSASSY